MQVNFEDQTSFTKSKLPGYKCTVIAENYAEAQVLRNALEMYARNYSGDNMSHLALANEMNDKLSHEYANS